MGKYYRKKGSIMAQMQPFPGRAVSIKLPEILGASIINDLDYSHQVRICHMTDSPFVGLR